MRFAVTLLARPNKLDVGDHSCFASHSCDEQVIVGRKVVLIGFFGQSLSPISHQVTLPCCPQTHLHTKKLHQLAFACAGCHHQQDVKWGGCYTLDSFQLGSIITGFPRWLIKIKNPPEQCPRAATPHPPSGHEHFLECCESGAGRYHPPFNIENDAIQLISKIAKFQLFLMKSVV